MDIEKIGINGALRLTPKDDRDFKFAGFFDLPKPETVPNNFIIAPLSKIKDQGNSDFCTAYSAVTLSEYQEGIDLSPEYQMMKTRRIMGEIESWGGDLRSACKALVKYGSLPEIRLPEEFKYNGNNREFVLNWNNWAKEIDKEAAIQRKSSYYKVSGRYDTFDDYRCTMWANIGEKRAILTGAVFKDEWIQAGRGIIPKKYSDEGGFAHAFIIVGSKEIEGELYLIAQLSNGSDIGDKGFFYFPREVVNREFTFGGYTFKDIDSNNIKYLISHDLDISKLWRAKLFQSINSFFKSCL